MKLNWRWSSLKSSVNFQKCLWHNWHPCLRWKSPLEGFSRKLGTTGDPVLTHCPALLRPWHLVQPLLQGGSASAPLTNQALSGRAKPGLLRTAGSHPAISCQQKCAAGITPNSKLKKASKTQLKQSYLCSQTPEAQLMDLLDVPAGTRHTLSIGKLHISFQMQTGL